MFQIIMLDQVTGTISYKNTLNMKQYVYAKKNLKRAFTHVCTVQAQNMFELLSKDFWIRLV